MSKFFDGLFSKKKAKVIEPVKDKPHLKGCTCLVCKPVAVEKVVVPAKVTKAGKGKAKNLSESAKEGTNGSEPQEKATLGQSGTIKSGNKQLDDIDKRVKAIETAIRGNPVETGIATGIAVILVIAMIVLIIWWLPQAGEIPFIHMRFK